MNKFPSTLSMTFSLSLSACNYDIICKQAGGVEDNFP